MTDQYLGYVEIEDLPKWACKGQRVRFAAGARLHTLKKGAYKAKRAQTVTIDHVLWGRSTKIGTILEYEDDPSQNQFWQGKRSKDVIGLAQHLGYTGGSWDDDATWTFLRGLAIREPQHRRHDEDGGKFFDLWLHVSNPSVRWPGGGGYWVECDINDVDIELLHTWRPYTLEGYELAQGVQELLTCKLCGIVRQANGSSDKKPCKGPVKVGPR